MFNKSLIAVILSYTNKVTKYWHLLTYFIVFKLLVNYNILGVDFMLDFMVEIHEGSHKHAYIYKWFCPVVVFKTMWDFFSGVNRILFYAFMMLFFMWIIKEIIFRNRSSNKGLFTAFNKLAVFGLFSKQKNILSYNFNQLFLKTTILIHSIKSSRL